jgi:hypothetical protein
MYRTQNLSDVWELIVYLNCSDTTLMNAGGKYAHILALFGYVPYAEICRVSLCNVINRHPKG